MSITNTIEQNRECDSSSHSVRVIHVGGANPSYVPLGEQIGDILATFLTDIAYMRDGQGNCGEVAAIAHAVATRAGYTPRLMGGNCFDAEGKQPFGKRGGHYWVEMPDGVVIDGAGMNRVNIYRPDALGYRMIPIIGRRKAACMIRAKTWLELSASLQKGMAVRGSNFLRFSREAA